MQESPSTTGSSSQHDNSNSNRGNVPANATASSSSSTTATTSPPPPSLSSLQNLLASVIRVRNRLSAQISASSSSTDDEKAAARLYHILTGLLPRLLPKLDENSIALVVVVSVDTAAAAASSRQEEQVQEALHKCRLELQSQLVGTISYAMEMMRGISLCISSSSTSDITEPAPAVSADAVSEAASSSSSSACNVISSLLPLLETLQSNVARTMLLLLLQTCMNAHCHDCHRRVRRMRRIREQQQQEQEQPRSYYCSFCPQTIPALIQRVNRIHAEILLLQQQQQQAASSADDDDHDGDANGIIMIISETLHSHYRMTGWLLLNAIAVQSGLIIVSSGAATELLEDASFDDDAISTNTNNWDHYLGLEPATPAAVQASAGVMGSAGTLDLFLDMLLFWPLAVPNNLLQQQEQQRRRWQDGGEFDNSTGISWQGMKRMNHPVHHPCGGTAGPSAAEPVAPVLLQPGMRVDPLARAAPTTSSSWNELHLRQLKYVTLKYAIWPAGKGLFQTPSAAANAHDDDIHGSNRQIGKTGDDAASVGGTISDRALLLAVLFASPNSMHGRLALSVINPHLLGGHGVGRLLRRVGNEWHCQRQHEQAVAESKCSSALACAILILMLGDAAAQPVLSKYNKNNSHHHEEHSWMSILGPRPTFPQFQRPPLPVHIASRGMDFIRNHFKPSMDTTNHVDDGIRLFVDLAVAIQDPRRHGAYWGIQLIQPLYNQNQKLLQHRQARNDAAMTGIEYGEGEDWMSQFHKQCLLTARAVLSTVPEATVLQIDPRNERRPQDQQPVHEGGVHPFGPRGDLNRLLADHRVSRKKRRLRSEGALQARQTAYNMIAELCSTISCSSGSFPLQLGTESKEGETGDVCNLDLPALIFQCAASEEESLQPLVARTLEALLLAYKKRVDDKTSRPHHHNLGFVAPLLPSLICAASADSTVARLAVARWCSEFLAHHDPDAALHICHYLTNDPDSYISNVAKKAIPMLKILGTSPSSSPSSVVMALPVKLLDMKHPPDVMEIQLDLQQRIQYLAANRFPNLSDCTHRSEFSQILLQDYRYSIKAVEEALELDYKGTVANTGLSCSSDMRSDVVVSKDQEFICGICYDETLATEGFAMPCGHRYCFPCWRSYLDNILADGANSNGVTKAKCPENSCSQRILTRHVHEIHSDLSSQWADALLTHFLELDESYRPCPGPDCRMVAHVVSKPNAQSIACTQCHTSFCFQCGREPHEPAKCSDFTAWNLIFGSSEFWVKKNAKPCPSCGVPIEKNDGCNHMKCSRCSTDFCWLCLSPLYRHLEAHTCNRFDPTTIAENDEQRRALFYTDRYQAHDDAEMFVKDRLKTLDHSLAKLTERFWFVTEDELEILAHAIETLARARRCLKYSYITAWAKRRDRESQHAFESHQATLELVTERLSNMTVVKWDDLYNTQGERGVRRFFGAISFHTSSITRYMTRLQLHEEE